MFKGYLEVYDDTTTVQTAAADEAPDEDAMGNLLSARDPNQVGHNSLFDARNLATSAALVPFGILGTVLGIWLHRNMSQKTFYVIVYGLLGLTGSKLLWDGIRGLMAAG